MVYLFMELLNLILILYRTILDICHERRFISYPVCINDLLERQDCRIFKEVTSINNHPLAQYIPSKKVCFYNLRIKQCARPKINTELFKSAFVNRLILKHNLLTGEAKRRNEFAGWHVTWLAKFNI